VLFGGDAYSPSLMSNAATKGRQMVPVLNALGVKCAVVGNHDLDFGVENMVALNRECDFPWLMANVRSRSTGRPLGGAGDCVLIEHAGWKVGVLGVVEEEWMATLSMVDPADVEYVDFCAEARRLAGVLRGRGADLVVALTHSRVPNDQRLCEDVPEVDLVLGGHDHHWECRPVAPHGTWMVKAGTDFRWGAEVTVTRPTPGGRVAVEVTQHTANADVEEDEEVAGIVREFGDVLGASMDKVIGFTSVDLDGRFDRIRTGETNLGNLVCDVLREWCDTYGGADVVLLNSGTLRSDAVHPRGALTVKDFSSILPMVDETCILGLTGAQLVEALENSVSQWPKLEGRFCQVSGVAFQFDGGREGGSRVVEGSVTVGGQALDPARQYRVCVKSYMATGKDGFDCLTRGRNLTGSVEMTPIPTCLAGHFMRLKWLSLWDELRAKHNARAVVDQWRGHVSASQSQLAREPASGGPAPDAPGAAGAADAERHRGAHGVGADVESPLCHWSVDFQALTVKPAVEGRIVNVSAAPAE